MEKDHGSDGLTRAEVWKLLDTYTDEDTEGCILLGMKRDGDTVLQSRAACELFQSKIALPLAQGKAVTLTVREAPTEIRT